MKPNFALGLTEHGITLWQRDGAGWLRVGAVAKDAADLEDQMRALVAKAEALAPEGIATKLVIPDEHILYTRLTGVATASAIRDALAGRTPYPVEELDFDWTPHDNGVQAAVVARETLIEAEEFAKVHGLNPVCFVAAPNGQGFEHEPFFKLARGVTADPADLGKGGPILYETGLIKPADTPVQEPVAPTSKPDEASASNVGTAPKVQSSPDDTRGSAKPPEPKVSATSPVTQGTAVKPVAKPAPTLPAAAKPMPDASAENSVSFRSRRAADPQQPAELPPVASAVPPPAEPARPSKALNALSKTRSLSLGSLGGAALAEKLRASVATPVARAGSGLRNASALGRKLGPKDKADTQSVTTAPHAWASPVPAENTKALRADASASRPAPVPEAERLTVFGARRNTVAPEPNLPRRALLISGAALMLVLAVAIWVVYFNRAPISDLVQPDLPAEATLQIATPDPLALPDMTAQDPQEIEAALGVTDAAEERGSAPEPQASSGGQNMASPDAQAPEVSTSTDGTGRLAGLRSVRAIAPEAPGGLPAFQDAPAPFGANPLPPLRDAIAEAVAESIEPPAVDAPAAATLPSGEDALEITVTQGRPATVPPARPAGIAPEPEPEPDPEPVADPAPAVTATQPLDESALVINVTSGAPPSVPPTRPEGIAPEAAPEEAAPEEAAPDSRTDDPAEEADQASLAPPPGGVALSMFTPAARPAAIAEQAAAQAEQFTSATPQAVAASLRPSNRPSGFSQTVQRALAAARIREVATPEPAPEPEIVQASAASVAPRIPSSASVSRSATETRAINLRKINLLGVTGTPSARRALVRLDSGRVVTVQVGERLDGGQVTAIGDNELRYNKRGRDVVLRIAS